MKITINISKGVILPVYFPFVYDYSHRYNVYYGGRASGKTYFLIQKLLIKSLKEKRNILISVDGGVNLENKHWLKDVDIITSGSCVTKSDNYQKTITELRDFD